MYRRRRANRSPMRPSGVRLLQPAEITMVRLRLRAWQRMDYPPAPVSPRGVCSRPPEEVNSGWWDTPWGTRCATMVHSPRRRAGNESGEGHEQVHVHQTHGSPSGACLPGKGRRGGGRVLAGEQARVHPARRQHGDREPHGPGMGAGCVH